MGLRAFCDCEELKSMTIPDSLQTLGEHVFLGCFNLVPSSIDVHDTIEDIFDDDVTDKVDVTDTVVVYLATKQMISIDRWLSFISDFYRFVAPFITDDTLMTMWLVSKA
ncbi:hypothetical protein TL16_g06503 [Triparma laevis f. inornata]|uniref:Uncharacterized protein n=2 Tax=Triparma laevis TaxID=1534972 RepID=A0A9W6Z9S2_9STRA|nr:hypothetical protein TrLO_g14020 [Triparma laevis f. longispina]GMH74581.1 hypothetical protein TL16_g06503 [Triparma laevis f. inornata]